MPGAPLFSKVRSGFDSFFPWFVRSERAVDVVKIVGLRFNCVPCDNGERSFDSCGDIDHGDNANLESYTYPSTEVGSVNTG